ncbi:MAG TPA: PPE domain-containing protein [Mycobacterium sp.]|jgi:PPE-repeat protein|nr:PPE domain-containing protein [Mycobacterium sp.]
MAGQFSAFPPEVNAGQLMAGDQGASIAAAVAAYEALAAALMEEGARMGTTAGTTAATGWEGAGGAAMVATAMPYVAALEALAGWVQQSAASAAAIEQAYAVAKAAMIQVPICTTNRTAQAGLVATNVIGQNTPAIVGLDTEYFGHFWTNNASLMGSYEAFVTPIIAALGVPPPPAPLTANPAGPAGQAAAIGQAAANGGANAAMSQSLQGVEQASGAVQPGTAAPAGAAQSMGSMAPQMLSQFGQLPQMLGQFPQMLGQFPQMAMGMLGPLTQGMNAGGATAGLEKAAATVDPTTLAATTDAAARGGGAGGTGGLGGAGGVMSSFTRPTGSFNAPGPPKLPTGWAPGAGGAPEVASSVRPAGTGAGGGLYGAPPPPMPRDERGKEAAEGRTVQLTVGPRTGRED